MSGSPSKLTHADDEGQPRMVDVSEKGKSLRRARAEGALRMTSETLEALLEGESPKGDVLQVARIAGIQAGKRTGELIPLCHLLPATSVTVEVEADRGLPGVRVRTEAKVAGRTGVEMEALTAASVALLTVYDMLKALDRGMVLEGIRLTEKSGGRSGRWSREEEE
jgi:cyclic pyranopterin phosphate synthase